MVWGDSAAIQPSQRARRFGRVDRHFLPVWDSDRLLARRLHGLAALDPDFEQVLRERQGRRREGLHVIFSRLAATHRRLARKPREETVDVVYALAQLERFDALAGTKRGAEQVAVLMQRMVRVVLGFDEESSWAHGYVFRVETPTDQVDTPRMILAK